MTDTAATPIRSAFPELVALAAAVRHDWAEDVISGTLRQAADKEMPWPVVLVKFPRLMADPGASPRDLLPDSADPLVRHHPDPDVATRGAAAVREALMTATSTKDTPDA
jgi:hypothetical protein